MKKSKSDGLPTKTPPVRGYGVGLIVLSAFFLCGVVAGCLVAFHVDGEASGTLQDILREIPQAADSRPAVGGLFGSALFNTFKFPLAVFLLGLTLLGVAGIPAAMAFRGFSLSFAVSAFARGFGSQGLLLALCVLGMQTMLTLPCLFCLADAGLRTSLSLLHVYRGRVKTPLIHTLPAAYFLRFALMAVVLTAAALFETLAVPPILRLIAGRIGGV